MSKFAVILAAAGKSSRFNAKSNPFAGGLRTKPFVALNGRAVWLYSAERFALRKDVAEIVLVVSPEDRREVERKRQTADSRGMRCLPAGSSRAAAD